MTEQEYFAEVNKRLDTIEKMAEAEVPIDDEIQDAIDEEKDLYEKVATANAAWIKAEGIANQAAKALEEAERMSGYAGCVAIEAKVDLEAAKDRFTTAKAKVEDMVCKRLQHVFPCY